MLDTVQITFRYGICHVHDRLLTVTIQNTIIGPRRTTTAEMSIII